MKDNSNINDDLNNSFNKGITLQRELFKQAMIEKDYNVATTCIDNIKVEIKNRAINNHMKDRIKLIESCINWFRTIKFRYRKNTPNGIQLQLPERIENQLIYVLNGGYEEIIIILNNLKII